MSDDYEETEGVDEDEPSEIIPYLLRLKRLSPGNLRDRAISSGIDVSFDENQEDIIMSLLRKN